MRPFLLPYLLLAVLYGSVGYFSPGYDDEIFNIRLIEKHGGDWFALVSAVEGMDVHPPGSYLIDAVLFRLCGDWGLVRLIVSLFASAAVVFAIDSARRREGTRSALLLYGLLGLNPALLLWCTGLRWYAFFVPVLVWLTTLPPAGSRRYWLKCFAGLLALGYLGYAVLVVALPVLALYWVGAAGHWRDKLRAAWAYAAVALLLYLPQAYFFLTVHARHKDKQIFSLAKGLVGFAAAQLSNQGVFPLSLPGLMAIVGSLGVAATLMAAGWRRNFASRQFLAYAFAVAVMLATGLAGKMRNFVVLAGFQARWLAGAQVEPRVAGAFRLFMGLVLAANVWGVVNVVAHRETTKANWNLPVAEVLDRLAATRAGCNGDLLVLSHDKMLSWHLANRGFEPFVPAGRRGGAEPPAAATHACLALVKTFAGTIGREQYGLLIGEVEALRQESSERLLFGRDAYAEWKRKVDPAYPDYGAEIVLLRGVSGVDTLRHWRRQQSVPTAVEPLGE